MRSENQELPSLLVENPIDCKAIEKSAQETDRILDCIGDLLFVIDKNRIIIKVNKSTCDMFKKKPEELIGRHCYKIVHGTKAPWCNCPATKTFKTKQTVTEEVNDPNLGIPLLVTTSPILDEHGEVVQVIHIAKDITERKQTEEALRESEKKLRSVIENSSDKIFMLDRECRFLLINKTAAALFGMSPQELIGKLLSEKFPETIAAQFSWNIKNVFDTGKSMFIEEKIVAKGLELINSTSLNPVRDDGGKVIAVIGILRDITERKKDEEKLRESSYKIEMMNEKLRVVGGLTRHDVRNKLSAITGYAYLLKKRHKDLADVVDKLSRMEQAVAESVKIFDFAKKYEQLGVEELAYVDVEKALNEAVGLFSGLTIKVVNGCHGLTVLADSLLRQLFYNFIDNTRKYGQKTTTIKVYFEKTGQDELKLVYEDDGVGILCENKPKLFHEGFSTGGSTGYGLFLTNKMMDVYGWKIEENGEPGKGVKLTITIPKLNGNSKENYQIVS